jgi:hypothetical protein
MEAEDFSKHSSPTCSTRLDEEGDAENHDIDVLSTNEQEEEKDDGSMSARPWSSCLIARQITSSTSLFVYSTASITCTELLSPENFGMCSHCGR